MLRLFDSLSHFCRRETGVFCRAYVPTSRRSRSGSVLSGTQSSLVRQFATRHVFSKKDVQKSPLKLPPFSQRVVSLSPTHLNPLNYIDISGVKVTSIYDGDAVSRGLTVLKRQEQTPTPTFLQQQNPGLPVRVCITYCNVHGSASHIPFPAGTHGYLYYYYPADIPAVASEIRFKIMPDVRTTDPSSGRDLLLPSGRPWGIPLCTVATSAGYGLLKNMLLREQLVTPATLDASLHLRVSFQKNTRQIHSLDEPFYVGFSKCRDYEVVGDGGVRIIFQGGRQWFSDDRDKSKIGLALVDRLKPHSIFKPYKGSAMCRFVRSTLPEHADMRALLLQVVTIIEPAEAVSPDYDGYVPMPCEGQLCHVGGRIWSCILDKNHATAALQALCDRDW